MSQKWDFHAIAAESGSIQGAVTTTQGLLDEGKASLAKLAAAWGGSGSEAYQAVQRNWDGTSTELNASLQALSQRITEAGEAMQNTESGVANMFS